MKEKSMKEAVLLSLYRRSQRVSAITGSFIIKLMARRPLSPKGGNTPKVSLPHSSDVVSETCFLFSQAADGSPETHIPSPRLDDQRGSDDDEKHADTEIKNSHQELHDHEGDRAECESPSACRSAWSSPSREEICSSARSIAISLSLSTSNHLLPRNSTEKGPTQSIGRRARLADNAM